MSEKIFEEFLDKMSELITKFKEEVSNQDPIKNLEEDIAKINKH